MKITGNVHKYGDNVDTDVIIPARYLNEPDHKALASHCMEDIDADFAKKVQPGDIMVADRNFGCGSSREHAPIAIKASGISVRHRLQLCPRSSTATAINIGLPIMECPEAAEGIEAGDKVSVDFETGEIVNETKGQTYQAAAFPPFIQGIIDSGGLLKSLKARGLAE